MNQTMIINFLLMLSIILLILKLTFYKHESFNSSILNCKKFNYLCKNRKSPQNKSLYFHKRREYLINFDKFSPRYNPSSRNKNRNRYRYRYRNSNSNSNEQPKQLFFMRKRNFNPHA